MLDYENKRVEPKILEFNFNPDCSRVSQIYPNFYNDILDLTYSETLPETEYYIPLWFILFQ